MPALLNLAGQRFGRLLVTSHAANHGARTTWNVHCDCGRTIIARAEDLRSGNTKSCGCLRADVARQLNHTPVVDYFGAHQRVRTARGPAGHHQCVDCGDRAQDWSYDHADPTERFGTSHTGRGLAYSLNPLHYQPRCKPCHGAFDAPTRKAADHAH